MKKAIRDRGDGSTVPCGTDITVPLSQEEFLRSIK